MTVLPLSPQHHHHHQSDPPPLVGFQSFHNFAVRIFTVVISFHDRNFVFYDCLYLRLSNLERSGNCRRRFSLVVALDHIHTLFQSQRFSCWSIFFRVWHLDSFIGKLSRWACLETAWDSKKYSGSVSHVIWLVVCFSQWENESVLMKAENDVPLETFGAFWDQFSGIFRVMPSYYWWINRV